jgi:hypothetical protein
MMTPSALPLDADNRRSGTRDFVSIAKAATQFEITS